MENGKSSAWFVGNHSSRGFGGGVAHHEVEGSRRGLTEACVTVKRNSYADRGILAGKLEAAFQQAIVNLVDV